MLHLVVYVSGELAQVGVILAMVLSKIWLEPD
jgi:hypothetical protein